MSEKRGLRLRVPPPQVEVFSEFARLSDATAEVVLDVLQRDPPILGLSQVADFISAAAPDLDRRASDLVDALTALVILQTSHEWGIDEVADAIAAADNLDLDTESRSQLAARLRVVLKASSLLVNAKAADLAGAHERVFHLARIVTEARPVYGEDADVAPAAAVITHFLELAYFGPNGDVESVYVGLNEASLSTLARQVERAQAKTVSLRKFLNDQGLYVFDLAEKEGHA